MKVLLLCGLAILAYASVASSLECYVCNYVEDKDGTNEDCGKDGFDDADSIVLCEDLLAPATTAPTAPTPTGTGPTDPPATSPAASTSEAASASPAASTSEAASASPSASTSDAPATPSAEAQSVDLAAIPASPVKKSSKWNRFRRAIGIQATEYVCVKHWGVNTDEKEYVTRTCEVKPADFTEDTCTEGDEADDGTVHSTCRCVDDHCNSATSLGVASMFIPLLAVLLQKFL